MSVKCYSVWHIYVVPSQVEALAYSNFFFGQAGIIKLFLKFQLKSTRHSFFSLRL